MTHAQQDVRSQFLDGMSKVASTVTVVTTGGAAGRTGVTVSAMSSVSADGGAPTLLVCIHHESPAAQAIIQNGCFCTNVLSQDQALISNVFAGFAETADGDKFSCASWAETHTGALRLETAVTAFDCKLISSERVGTHHIMIGAVQETYVLAAGQPLLYAERAYQSLSKLEP